MDTECVRMEEQSVTNKNILISELYFLISKFLANGPLQETAQVLARELEHLNILPRRLDWTGQEHHQTLQELERKYPHIGPSHLLEICARIGPLLDKELAPSVPGVLSLLGAGRQSVLRTQQSITAPRQLVDYWTRLHHMPLADAVHRNPNHNIVRLLYGRESAGPLIRRQAIPTSFYSKQTLQRRTLGHLSAVYCVLFDRSGKYIVTGADDLLVKLWSAIDGRLLATFRGASAEITDIAINLDNTMLAAGSLDRILRVWDLQYGGPIAVLSGHTGMITSVNFCPSPKADLRYLVTTSTDGSVAFWEYTNRGSGGKPNFNCKPVMYHEKLRPGQAQMICASFSPGGIFLAAGSADHHVRVYLMSEDGPKRILETESHSDTVDSIQWAHSGLRFISGSKDGTALVWHFETQQWKSIRLHMTERLASCPVNGSGAEAPAKAKVTMVSWDATDDWVITAANDFTIKVWNAHTGKLHRVLRGHTNEIYVLESHQKDSGVLLSAGHDGQLFIWDIMSGVVLAHFLNHIDGQGDGGIFDAKWSPDGTMIAATDSHGHILMFGYGSGHDRFQEMPRELFFHTDYRPLIRDSSHHVMDEQTQTMPHLMPPPFLVDIDGNPYPPQLQRLVPGRENCPMDQLIPNIGVGPGGSDGDEEQQQGRPAGQADGPAYSNIDRMIEALANRQAGVDGLPPLDPILPLQDGGGGAADVGENNRNIQNEREAVPQDPAIVAGPAGAAAVQQAEAARLNGGRPQQGLQRLSSATGGGNWHREGGYKFHRRQYVRPMGYALLQNLKQRTYAAGLQEHEAYRRELRRRPLMINTSNGIGHSAGGSSQANRRSGGSASRNAAQRNNASRRRPQPQHLAVANGGVGGGGGGGGEGAPAYRTRAVRENEAQPEDGGSPSDDRRQDSMSTSSDSSSNSDDSTAIEEEDLDLSGSSSTDTESSDYSDWVSHEPGRNLEPPKRSKRKHVQRRAYSPPEIDQPGPSSSSGGGGGGGTSSGRRPKVRKIPITRDGEIPEAFRPPEWLSEVIPRKAPYYPQMGDEVVYFRQGHARYLDAVRTKSVYNLGNKCEPWATLELRDHEFCKVIGIKYEIRPPRLCCLKLAIMDSSQEQQQGASPQSSSGYSSGRSFVIKYHDMPDVLDFLVLKQTFDTSVGRNWGPGDRFRCMIEDVWWLGQIESHNQLSPEFPDSLFMCFRVRWDNGEYENMSPWDLEPVEEGRLPVDVGGAVPVLPDELRAMLYQPKAEEWPRGDREGSCRRIIAGLEQVMGLAIADLFLAPVDLNIYPEYAFVVEYPIDLNTIKARFENHFYRRITSAQFDVRYLATNAEKFNESHSNIVKHARIVTDLCLRILGDCNEVDVPAVYHQLVDTYISSDSDSENQPGPSTSARSGGNSSNNRRPPTGSRRSRRLVPEGDWRVDCRELLEMIWQCDDSEPFREPVDTIQHPDYLQIVDTPMDLRTIKEDLLGGNYESPLDFCKDMKLIFQNSRNYNTNKRSRIYSMTLRLSTLFEAHIKPIIYNWKSARRRGKANAAKRSSGGAGGGAATGSGGGGSRPSKSRARDSGERRRNRGGTAAAATGDGSGPSTSSSNRRTNNGGAGGGGAGSSLPSNRANRHFDDDDDDDDEEIGPPQRKRPTRNGATGGGGSYQQSSSSRRVLHSSSSNGGGMVSSSSANVSPDLQQPGPSRIRTSAATTTTTTISNRTKRRLPEDEHGSGGSLEARRMMSSQDSDDSSSETTDDDDDSSDDSAGVPVSHRHDYDSGEMYDPYQRKKKKKSKPKKAKKNPPSSSSNNNNNNSSVATKVTSSTSSRRKPPGTATNAGGSGSGVSSSVGPSTSGGTSRTRVQEMLPSRMQPQRQQQQQQRNGATPGGEGSRSMNRTALIQQQQQPRRNNNRTPKKQTSSTTTSGSGSSSGGGGGGVGGRTLRRSGRNHTGDSDDDEDSEDYAGEGPSGGRSQRTRPPLKRLQQQMQSDHSYHKARPKSTPRIASDTTDHGDDSPRSMRSAARRPQPAAAPWGRSEEDEDSSLGAPPNAPSGGGGGRSMRPRPAPMVARGSEPEHSPEEASNISKRGSSQRAAAIRARNWPISQDSENDAGEGPSAAASMRTTSSSSPAAASAAAATSNARAVRAVAPSNRPSTTTTSSSSHNSKSPRKAAAPTESRPSASTTSSSARRRMRNLSSSHSSDPSSSATPPPHTVDHNYGEPSPASLRRRQRHPGTTTAGATAAATTAASSGATTNRNRTGLSRHQRNADELDAAVSTVEEEDHSAATEEELQERRQRRRRINEEEDEEDEDDQPLRRRQPTRGRDDRISSRLRSKTGSPVKRKRKSEEASSDDDENADDGSDEEFTADGEEEDDDEEAGGRRGEASTDDDSEYNTPLQIMSARRNASGENTAGAKTARSNLLRSQQPQQQQHRRSGGATSGLTRSQEQSANVSSRTRQKDRFSSEDDYGEPGPSTQRNTRNLKRLRYNEDTDDEEDELALIRPRSKRPASNNPYSSNFAPQHQNHSSSAVVADGGSSSYQRGTGGSSSNRHSTRRNGEISYAHTADDDDSDLNDSDDDEEGIEAMTSVSSRGRVRRINPKMRKIFRE